MYKLSGVTKNYQKGRSTVAALRGVDLVIEDGEWLAVQGPTGHGKSTLLQILGGLDRPSSGIVDFDGRDLAQLREAEVTKVRAQSIGFVFQAFQLMDELTAVENVELPALLGGRSPRAARRRAEELLERVGLASRSRFLPTKLSGGQRQRVAIARALVADPALVLADEPTGNLDSAATMDVLRLFDSLHQAGQTLVIVTHDTRIAATADRMISMRDGSFTDQARLNSDTSTGLSALAGLED